MLIIWSVLAFKKQEACIQIPSNSSFFRITDSAHCFVSDIQPIFLFENNSKHDETHKDINVTIIKKINNGNSHYFSYVSDSRNSTKDEIKTKDGWYLSVKDYPTMTLLKFSRSSLDENYEDNNDVKYDQEPYELVQVLTYIIIAYGGMVFLIIILAFIFPNRFYKLGFRSKSCYKCCCRGDPHVFERYYRNKCKPLGCFCDNSFDLGAFYSKLLTWKNFNMSNCNATGGDACGTLILILLAPVFIAVIYVLWICLVAFLSIVIFVLLGMALVPYCLFFMLFNSCEEMKWECSGYAMDENQSNNFESAGEQDASTVKESLIANENIQPQIVAPTYVVSPANPYEPAAPFGSPESYANPYASV